MSSRIISLGKKISNGNYTDEEFCEWCSLHGISIDLVDTVRKGIERIDKKSFARFKKHLLLFGNKVTIDRFITCPLTSNHLLLYQHYGVEVPKKIRQNVYDPNYISNRDGISFEDAVAFVEKYKKEKSTHISNFIRKYGSEEGTKRYNEWFDASLKKGHDSHEPKSKLMVSYWTKRGYTEEQAYEEVKRHQYSISPLHVDYYILRGRSLTDARKSIRKIHDKKIGRCSVTEYLLRMYPDADEETIKNLRKEKKNSGISKIGAELYAKKLEKTRKTFEQKGLWTPLEDLSDYENYRRLVWIYTNQNDLTALQNYDKRAKAGVDGGYHLDHKFSISRGYVEGVPPEVIGCLANLVFLPWRENVVKQGKCSIEKEILYEFFKNKEDSEKCCD